MEHDFLRYSCQMALPGFSGTSQQRLQSGRVLIVGAGGLGCPAAQYLAAAGVGTIGIADDDTVSVSNLHRQILYTPGEAGRLKAEIASGKLQQQNPGIRLVAHPYRITADNAAGLLQDYDLVVDATDNFEARYLLNDAAVLAGKPVVYGAIYQYEGQVAVWNGRNEDGSRTPNYRDLFPEVNAALIPDCATGGVLPTLAGIIGCMMAGEVIKYFTGTGELLTGRLLILDALSLRSRIIRTGNVTKTAVTGLPQATVIPTVTAADVQQAPDRFLLIDVRTDAERAAMHIGGQHIPLDTLGNAISSLPQDRPVVCYCASGKRSAAAVVMIRKQLPDLQVYSLEGGVNAIRR